MAEQQIERVDPEPRLEIQQLGTVTNPAPDRVYMLANPNEPMFGYDAMESIGWKPLIKGCKEKVQGARLAPDGTDRFMVQGQIVMWRPKAEQERYLAQKHAYARQQLAAPNRNETVVIDGNKQ